MTYAYATPIHTLADAVEAHIAVWNGALQESIAAKQEMDALEDRAYLGVLYEMQAHLAQTHRTFHNGAIRQFARNGLTREIHPRTYVHQQELVAERLAYQWLLWLVQ